MLTLNTELRKKIGRGVKILKKQNCLPGIVYGKEIGSVPLKVNYEEFIQVWGEAGEGTIINLKVGKPSEKQKKVNEYPVLIREVQKDPLSEELLHVDFYQLPMDREVEVTVPFVFEGEAPAEKDQGGVLIKNLHEVRIKGLPKNLIPSIRINLSSLVNIDDSIKIKDLLLPENISILANLEEIVVLAREVQEEEMEVTPEESRPEEVEVIGEKEEERIEEEQGETQEREKREDRGHEETRQEGKKKENKQ